MKKSGQSFIILILIVLLILTTSCSSKNDGLSILEGDNMGLESESINIENDIIATNTSMSDKLTIEYLLNELDDWDGKKDLGEVIYTLNLDSDKYILTIYPNRDNSQELNWVEIIYFKPMEEDTTLTSDEIKPMKELVSIISPYWIEDSEWSNSILNKEFPLEESIDNWSLEADYYVYNGKNEGIYVKVDNLDKTVVPTPENKDKKSDKRKVLASDIRSALNVPGYPEICTSVYFNKEGELIIEATSYWSNMSDSDKEDIIFLIKGILSQKKEELNVEGYGQFFSPTGRGLESFYAK